MNYELEKIYNKIMELKKQARIDFRNGSNDEDYGRLKAFEECLAVVKNYSR